MQANTDKKRERIGKYRDLSYKWRNKLEIEAQYQGDPKNRCENVLGMCGLSIAISGRISSQE
jgi:hypothetical protein